ncbi:DUF6777 domain-containing protein [Streptomyces sp. NPDC007369]|uniref:DUF6777 domain-containing protein n=1 Tax=Streptomyces sp. NPDC007369 TaxID=3154589 RepID=UPI0033DE796F
MPRVAAVTSGIAVAVVLAVVLTRPAGGPAQAGEVILQPTSTSGPDPFTPSTANTTTALPAAAPVDTPTEAHAIRSVSGAEPGLYGGTRNSSPCDVERQIRYVTADTGKNSAFASSLKVQPSAVPGYLRSLTPVQLRSDTRVTNHSYRDGGSTGYQAVLQAGTAVLVDGHGEPKVRCACGNPLARAVAQKGTPKQTGTSWSGYQPQNVVVVNRAPTVIKTFVIFDARHGSWVKRHSGDHGRHDSRTKPPHRHWPLPLPPGKSPHTRFPGTLSPLTKSPGTVSPGTRSPATLSPGTKSPATESPGTKPPATLSPATKPPATKTPASRPPVTKPATESPAPKSPASPPPVTKRPVTESPAAPASPASPAPVTKQPASESPAAPRTAVSPPPPASPDAPESPAAPVTPGAPVTPDVPAPETVGPAPRVTEPGEPERPAPPSGDEPPGNQPPGNDPPADDPPANDPPADDPPANDPPGNGNQE